MPEATEIESSADLELANHSAGGLQRDARFYEERRQRWCLYLVLIVCSMGSMVARLMTIQGESYGMDVPYLSANDRSRWSTIRALGDQDTFAIDGVLQSDDGYRWDSIDKVMHPGRDGKPHFYSSKPTLLPWLLSYEYLGLKEATGKNLEDDTFFIVRLMLLVNQILPMLFFFLIIAAIVEDLAKTDWTKFFVVATATFGTFLTTFAVTLNNHSYATVSTAITIWALIKIWRSDNEKWKYFILAGLFSAFAAANDLPALSLVAFAFVVCSMKSLSRTLIAFVPAAALIVGSFFYTNWMAHNDLTPPYGHRDDGPVIAQVDFESVELANQAAASLDGAVLPLQIKSAIVENADQLNSKIVDDSLIRRGNWPVPVSTNRWLLDNQDHSSRVVIVNQSDSETFNLHAWNNWYEYPGSYWRAENQAKASVDQGEKSQATYAAHFLIGHHGVFSLSPIWLWAIPGVLMLCFSTHYKIRFIGVGIISISVVVILFYVTRDELDRSYGGLTCGPRWLFWLIPMWLIALIPLLDRISKWGTMKVVAVITLFISAGSASYAWGNPWVHPWIYEIMQKFGG